VAATFISQLQDLDRHCPNAGKLLRVLTFLDPESIPLEMLITGAKVITESQQPSLNQPPLTVSLLALIQSPIARQHAVNHLQTRCLVAYHTTSQSPTFRIHDLIQLVVLENTKNGGLHQELFEFAVELVCAAFNVIEDVRSHESWPRCELLVPHLQSLTLRQDTSSKAKKALLVTNHIRALYLSNRGRFVEAENLYENIIADRQQLFRFNDVDTLAVMGGLAWVYLRRGRYVDAETLFKRVLEGYKTQLGPEDRDTLRTMYYLADVYYYQDRFDDAETLLKQILQSQESQFGSEDDDALLTMTLLAGVYNEQQRYDEAESLHTRVLRAQERSRLLGPEHRSTLITKHDLANVYISLRRYDAAAALLQQVLCILERNLGSQHPDTLLATYSLARVYTRQGCYGDAETLLVRVLAARERIFGLPHPSTQNALIELAYVYEKLGRLDEARMLELRSLPQSSSRNTSNPSQ
jgi:tetratricopeptide (TPR) repeat protein